MSPGEKSAFLDPAASRDGSLRLTIAKIPRAPNSTIAKTLEGPESCLRYDRPSIIC